MFEEYTEDYFLEQARLMGQELGVDTRQGSVYMDAATGHCIRAAKFYSDLGSAFEMLSIDSCTGEILDEKVKERNLQRKEATQSYYNVEFEGVEASELVDDRFMVAGYYFVLVAYDDGYYLMSEAIGIATNNIISGQPVIPLRNILNLSSVTLGSIYVAGADEERDESLRSRYKAVIIETSENGNKQQYKTWCESFEGVGRAVIYPLANGANTVKAVIISSEGIAPTPALISNIQEYIDPGSEGLGEGEAPIGCHFYAMAAEETMIDLAFDAELASGYTVETALVTAKEDLVDYLKNIALTSSDSDTMIIQYVKIVGILANSTGIKDFTNLLLNGTTRNISIGEDNVAVLGEVSMNVGI